jgi:pyruvate/2-oxoglutarate dehydrogenase complex dihydrolipoamide dehydrogenase (E3) component
MYRRFGSDVTVIERAPRLLSHEDPEVAAEIQAALEAEGIQIRLEDEAIHSIIDIMAARVPYTTLQNTVHIHPTVSELIPTVLGELGPTTSLSV